MVSTAGLSTAWAEMLDHDRWRFEVPDLIGFADGGPDGRDWRAGPWVAEGRLHRRVSVSKATGRTRQLAVLDPAVHARYRTVVARVATAVERSLGPEVTAGRCLGLPGGLRLEPWRTAWRRHARRVRALGLRSGSLLRVDVRDCYGSIRPEAVGEALGRCGVEASDARRVGDLLVRFADDGISGLPVGPEPSAVLANAALARADRSLAGLGLPFVRWCDDVTIGLGSTDPCAAVQAWGAALRPLGLVPAAEKTRLVEPGDSGATSWHGPAVPDLPARARAPESGTTAPSWCGRPSERVIGGLELERALVLERAAAFGHESDPHAARAVVACLGLIGGRAARMALRHIGARFPEHAATARWGLGR
jgi:hypothetical protein